MYESVSVRKTRLSAVLPVFVAGWPANQRTLGVAQNPNRVPLGGPITVIAKRKRQIRYEILYRIG